MNEYSRRYFKGLFCVCIEARTLPKMYRSVTSSSSCAFGLRLFKVSTCDVMSLSGYVRALGDVRLFMRRIIYCRVLCALACVCYGFYVTVHVECILAVVCCALGTRT